MNRTFSSKIRALFLAKSEYFYSISKKGQGRPPPASCAPVYVGQGRCCFDTSYGNSRGIFRSFSKIHDEILLQK